MSNYTVPYRNIEDPVEQIEIQNAQQQMDSVGNNSSIDSKSTIHVNVQDRYMNSINPTEQYIPERNI